MALAAQGFADPRPTGTPDRRALGRVLDRTGLLQIDSVNVLARAHYLPVFSRLGPYPTDLVDRAAWGRPTARAPRLLMEYWGHAASLLPVATHPLFRWRMAEADHKAWGRRLVAEHPALLADVLTAVRESGAATAGELEERLFGARTRRSGPWWDWSLTKAAVEYLFWVGGLTAATRRGFERVYDLPERVLPADVLAAPTPEPAAAQRELLRRSMRSLGVGTARDLRDYYRLPASGFSDRLAELVEEGSVLPVDVEGLGRAFLDPAARHPRRVRTAALLAPFDPLVWERDRTEGLFGFRYRIGIYTPASQREHGYYVLPFLLDEALVARVDLKADRAAGVLRVQSAFAEPGAPVPTAAALAAELRSMAGWLALGEVRVAEPLVGDLARTLRRVLGG